MDEKRFIEIIKLADFSVAFELASIYSRRNNTKEIKALICDMVSIYTSYRLDQRNAIFTRNPNSVYMSPEQLALEDELRDKSEVIQSLMQTYFPVMKANTMLDRVHSNPPWWKPNGRIGLLIPNVSFKKEWIENFTLDYEFPRGTISIYFNQVIRYNLHITPQVLIYYNPDASDRILPNSDKILHNSDRMLYNIDLSTYLYDFDWK